MDDNEENILEMNTIFPDAEALFSHTLEPVEKIKDNCLVVLDTNVLLFSI